MGYPLLKMNSGRCIDCCCLWACYVIGSYYFKYNETLNVVFRSKVSLFLLFLLEMDLKFFKLQALFYRHNHFFQIFCSICSLQNSKVKIIHQLNVFFVIHSIPSLLQILLHLVLPASIFLMKVVVVLTDGNFPIGLW